MVKRFVFENTSLGKQTSIISEESGSKLILISGAAQVMVKVDQLKGKTETPETMEVDLSTLIDVKGMKAMGNRLSQHPIKSVELLSEINPEVEETEPEPVAETEEVGEAEVQPEESSPKSEEPKTAPPKPTEKPVEPEQKPEETPHKKVDFEITNPDDIEMDDNGQLGLF